MTDWDNVAGDAAAQTDKELEAGLNKLMAADISKLFPNPIDREKVNALVKTIRQETNYNKRAAAFKGIMVTIGADLAKAVKAAMLTLAVFFLIGAGRAAAEDITVSGVNIKDLVSNTRIGVWLPFEGGKTFKTIYTPLINFHDAAGVEYVVLDVGSAAPGELTQGYAFLGLGVRLDNILAKSMGLSNWIKAHFSAVELPAIEAGVGPILYGNKVRFGFTAATKF